MSHTDLPPMRDAARRPGIFVRWYVYQRERFPVIGHGILILAFSFSAISYSALLRMESAGDFFLPGLASVLVAYVSCFLFFLQLRIADEFKDFTEDSRFRPYRPVPRGLVRLSELAVVFVLAAATQLTLTLWLQPEMAWLLAAVWIYLAAMSKEFFLRNWLKARPITYMWTHMLIMPLIDLYASACDWWIAHARPPTGLVWFLLASFFNGMVIEIGRKLRSPVDEEVGVETYSVLWGRRRAVAAWLGLMAATAACALVGAWLIDFLWPLVALWGVMIGLAVVASRSFLHSSAAGAGKQIERLSGLWTLALYLGLGALPMAWRWAAFLLLIPF